VVPGPRITNARPIRVDPLEARDTTREIAKDARKTEAPVPKDVRKGDAPIETRTVVAAAPPAKPAAPAPPHAQVAIAAPAEAAVPNAPRVAPEGDLVAARYAATRDWLASAPETTHTIQIMGISNDTQLKAHLAALGKTLEGSKIYIFRTAAHGKPWITVVYGAYADRKAALQAIEKLPPTVSSTKPVLRTVNGIRAEMKQNGTS
jgi:DamX protein